ncbi:MAG: hypothetical protein AAFU85_30470, partial [Planctomycetota bacterium]
MTAENEPHEEPKPPSVLRWWPALTLLILMAVLRFVPGLAESQSLSVMMVGFMGPPLMALFLLAWWCLGSRAGFKEKTIGLTGLAAVVTIGLALIHPTLRGMPMVINVIPTAIA